MLPSSSASVAWLALVADGTVPSALMLICLAVIVPFAIFAPLTAPFAIFFVVTAFLRSCREPTLSLGTLNAA